MIRKQKDIHNLLNNYFRQSIPLDVSALCSKLRQEDCNTIKFMTDLTPAEGLGMSYKSSLESYTIVIDGAAEGMFGVSGSKDVGQPWLLMSDWLLTHTQLKREFLIETRKWIATVIPKYKKLFNFFHKDHVDHRKWLEWLGFTVMDLYPEFGPHKKPFYYFEMKGMN